jgi:pimeloyl-ACP methyl ester carboxylesterase
MKTSPATWLALFLALAFSSLTAAAPAHKHQVAVDGFELTVWERSAKKPTAAILLVHGRTWSALPNFDLQTREPHRSIMASLAAGGYAVYAVDLRGYGGTPRDDTGWMTPTRAAADVIGILDWIAARHPDLATRPALLGYSRGAHIALLVAQERPAALSRLVLFALPSTRGLKPAAAPDEPARKPTTREAAGEDFITPGAAPAEVIEAYVSQAVSANPVRADWRDEQLFAFDAARLKTPTLFLYGANDPLLADGSAVEFFSRAATADRAFVILPDSDHAAHVENSQPAWLRAVTGFIHRNR